MVIWKNPSDLEDEKKMATKNEWVSKQKKEAEAPNIPTLYIYIHTTYGTLGNTYTPWLINTWWRMARNGALPPSSDGSPGMVLQHRLDTGRCCRRNNWQPPKWQFKKLAYEKKDTKTPKKKTIYLVYIYIYSVMAACVYIYILICIYIYSIVFQFFHFSWRFYKLQGCSVLFFNSCWMHECRLSLFEGTKWFLYHFSTNV